MFNSATHVSRLAALKVHVLGESLLPVPLFGSSENQSSTNIPEFEEDPEQWGFPMQLVAEQGSDHREPLGFWLGTSATRPSRLSRGCPLFNPLEVGRVILYTYKH